MANGNRLICHAGCNQALCDLANFLSPEGFEDYTAIAAGIHHTEDRRRQGAIPVGETAGGGHN
jgi:hypothetical protein